jgi:hypothetical protein
MSALSTPARLLFRPFHGYSELGKAEGEDAPTVAEGVLRILFVVGAVVATTATGHLAPIELVIAMGSFFYVPIIQAIAIGVPLRLLARDVPIRRGFALYLAGHGPWMITLVAIATIALVAPSPARTLFRALPPMVLATFAWGGVMTFACLRRGLGLSAARAGIGTFLHTIVLTALVVSYYLASDQLGPQLWR